MNADLPRSGTLATAWFAIAIGVDLILRDILPGLDATRVGLIIIALLAVLVALGVTFAQWWRDIGYTPLREWRDMRWLVVPALIAVLPLLAGIKPLSAQTYAILIAGYALTGFAEETMFRGVMVKLLERRSPIFIACATAVLFGLTHLANIVIRDESGIVVAQAIGAAAFGFGFAALRLRTNALLPLVVLHAAQDLFLQMGNLPLIPVVVVEDIILFVLGLWLLRGKDRTAATQLSPGSS
jgi:hypothetical protein